MSTITEQDILLVQKDILISLIERYNNGNYSYNLRTTNVIELTGMSSEMTKNILDSSLKHYKDFIKIQQLLLENKDAE